MPDVNILVYAHRRDETVHDVYREWLETLINQREPWALSILAAIGFVRIVTNSRIYRDPTPLALALATVDTLQSRSHCNSILPGARHWEIVSRLCEGSHAMGKLVADAQHAAIAVEHRCELVTRDRDFKKFEALGLRWRLFTA